MTLTAGQLDELECATRKAIRDQTVKKYTRSAAITEFEIALTTQTALALIAMARKGMKHE